MIFQDPLSSLHPYYKVGWQIVEMIREHERGTSKAAARERAIELLDAVGIPSPRSRIDSYPHEFSGGMRQRVMIAMAMALRPAVLVADEPTTALDVTVQAQVLDVMRGVQQEFGTAIVLITHDLGVVADMADDVVVMYGGQVMERAPRRELFYRRHHPYTEGLLRSLPTAGRRGRLTPIGGTPPSLITPPPGCPFAPRCPSAFDACARDAAVPGDRPRAQRRRAGCPVGTAEEGAMTALLEVADVRKYFPVGRRRLFGAAPPSLRAVDGVSLAVERGETLGLVGETGCGKSTLARCMTRLYDLTAGRVTFDGTDISTLSRAELRPLRREMQVMFQDPYGSLNPRRRVGSIIGDPFAIHGVADGEERKRKVQELMELVGLNPEHYNRFPAEFSGGQRQRIGIARALALKPKLVVCDEPVSALDVSIQAQIINLLAELQDAAAASPTCSSRTTSRWCGTSATGSRSCTWARSSRSAATEDLHEHTRHPYTRALLSAVPVADPDALAGRERVVLRGDLPSPAAPPSGCRFHPRCPKAQERCRTDDPELVRARRRPGHRVACHFPLADGELLTLSKPTIDDLAPDLTFDPTAAEEGTS